MFSASRRATKNLAFEIAAASPNYATPSNSLNDLVRLTSIDAPFADATGSAAAALTADTVIDVYFLAADPALGDYKAQFFAATDFTDAIARATFQYWRLDPHGTRLYNGNFYSPLDESLVDWSVVPETATFDGLAASGYITEFTVVPEPATLGLVAIGAAGAMLRRRRR
ncbi:MAG: PEP-CTERM sorting domain-containing protein [Planctomycetota bacterium]|nr:PEP-CTERM sorting domain-containing protein [Planctomycetota bacterium]